MKHFIVFIFVLLFTSCTIVKIYSGDAPYFLQENDIVFYNDSVKHDSIKIIYNNKLFIIKDGHMYDNMGNLIKM